MDKREDYEQASTPSPDSEGGDPELLWISTSPLVNKITIDEKLGIRPKPKRPLTAFLKYTTNIVRPKILKENPTMPITQITKLAAEQWKLVDDDLKKKLTDEFQEEMKGYRVSMAAYTQELSGVDKRLLDKHDPKIKREKNALKKKRMELGCPKKPISAYLMFLQKKRPEQGDIPYKDWMLKTAEEWKTLNSDEKSKYVRLFENNKIAYAEEMTAWERKMKESGNAHILNTGAPSSSHRLIKQNPQSHA